MGRAEADAGLEREAFLSRQHPTDTHGIEEGWMDGSSEVRWSMEYRICSIEDGGWMEE